MREIKMRERIINVDVDGYGFKFPMSQCDYETDEMFNERAKEYLQTYMSVVVE